jgi:hypothetical protein
MKTVILVWKNKYNGKYCDELFTLIKSTSYVYYLSHKLNFKLYVDIQHHSISKCLPNLYHPYQDFILDQKENICTVHDVEHYINTSTSDLLFFYTTTYLFFILDKNCNAFIRNILLPSPILRTRINPIQVENILHIHINNSIISTFKQPYLLHRIYNTIKPYITPSTIVLSDTYEIKQYIKEQQCECIIFDTIIGNIGFEPHDACVEDTLFDLHLMAKAKKIYSFSWNYDIPGFLKILSIYEVPIIELLVK